MRSILCPIDFSETSRHALRWAEALARRSHAGLTVLSVVEPLLADAARVRFGLDLATSETGPALREFAAATWPNDPTRLAGATFIVQVGEPADVIAEAAAASSADLIVMGTHGLGGVRKWLIGSTTERVLRRTRIAVLGVPSVEDRAVTGDAEAGLEAGPILVATDFTETAGLALRRAAGLAEASGAAVLLLHVLPLAAVAPQWQEFVETPDAALMEAARTRLRELAAQALPSQTLDCLVEVGAPADTIANVAEARKAAMIVMGVASHQGLFAARPGAIAYRVLGRASVPVLVVPHASN